jgi:acyl carrier protein
MKEKVLDILRNYNEDIVTFDGENLFDVGILDSLQAVDLVAELEDGLDIDIDAKYVVEENFKNKEAIIAMVIRITQG